MFQFSQQFYCMPPLVEVYVQKVSPLYIQSWNVQRDALRHIYGKCFCTIQATFLISIFKFLLFIDDSCLDLPPQSPCVALIQEGSTRLNKNIFSSKLFFFYICWGEGTVNEVNSRTRFKMIKIPTHFTVHKGQYINKQYKKQKKIIAFQNYLQSLRMS